MCGFVVVIDRTGRPVQERLLRAMAQTIDHRGPDGEGYYTDGAIGLAHKRLSIIDIEGGQQPMVDEAGERWIVFNGEIYNYVELASGSSTACSPSSSTTSGATGGSWPGITSASSRSITTSAGT
jgi:asparagine synthetase B (glutamine-hydrolysing)